MELLEQIKNDPLLCMVIVYFVNLVCDYPLQDEFMKKYKRESNYVLFAHSALWGIGVTLTLYVLGFGYLWIIKLIFLIVGHALIDAWKCRGRYKEQGFTDIQSLLIDQELHVIQILFCMMM